MQKRPLQSQSATDARDAVSGAILARSIDDWLEDNEIRQLSPNTISFRRGLMNHLLWFVDQQEFEQLGTYEIRKFLGHLAHGGETGGRYGNERLIARLRPVTVKTYIDHLRCFFTFALAEQLLEINPMLRITAPIVRRDQIQPFTSEHVTALIAAARRSYHPRRNHAIVLLLLDTGMRAAELCGLQYADIDRSARSCRILGKGNKSRTVYYGVQTSRAIWAYIREEDRDLDGALFRSDRGLTAGAPLTVSGLYIMVEKLGIAAEVTSARCSPHTFRHTCAVNLLRCGMDVFAVQQILGHTRLDMVNRYVAYAQADVARQYRTASPVDNLGKTT